LLFIFHSALPTHEFKVQFGFEAEKSAAYALVFFLSHTIQNKVLNLQRLRDPIASEPIIEKLNKCLLTFKGDIQIILLRVKFEEPRNQQAQIELGK